LGHEILPGLALFCANCLAGFCGREQRRSQTAATGKVIALAGLAGDGEFGAGNSRRSGDRPAVLGKAESGKQELGNGRRIQVTARQDSRPDWRGKERLAPGIRRLNAGPLIKQRQKWNPLRRKGFWMQEPV